MTPFEKLIQSNKDYHEAVEEILCVGDLCSVPEEQTEAKAKFGALTNSVFNMMSQVNEFIAPYYNEVEDE